MPEICRFYGIRITIYFDEHPPSHFHAEYGEYEAVFSVETGDIINGHLPATARKLVKKWFKLQKDAIKEVWNHIQNEEEFKKIKPLD